MGNQICKNCGRVNHGVQMGERWYLPINCKGCGQPMASPGGYEVTYDRGAVLWCIWKDGELVQTFEYLAQAEEFLDAMEQRDRGYF